MIIHEWDIAKDGEHDKANEVLGVVFDKTLSWYLKKHIKTEKDFSKLRMKIVDGKTRYCVIFYKDDDK